jgi:DNA-binding NarL/FixJ family response regulator
MRPTMTFDEIAARCNRSARTIRDYVRANYNRDDVMIGWNVRIEIAYAVIDHFRDRDA